MALNFVDAFNDQRFEEQLFVVSILEFVVPQIMDINLLSIPMD